MLEWPFLKRPDWIQELRLCHQHVLTHMCVHTCTLPRQALVLLSLTPSLHPSFCLPPSSLLLAWLVASLMSEKRRCSGEQDGPLWASWTAPLCSSLSLILEPVTRVTWSASTPLYLPRSPCFNVVMDVVTMALPAPGPLFCELSHPK